MIELNREAREKLETLLKTEPSSLTQADIDFLKARADYLSDDQKKMLKEFDTAKKEEVKEEADEAKAKAREEKEESKKK